MPNTLKSHDDEPSKFFMVDLLDSAIQEEYYEPTIKDPLKPFPNGEKNLEDNNQEDVDGIFSMEALFPSRFKPSEFLDVSNASQSPLEPSIEIAHTLETKPPPSHLKNAYMDDSNTLPVVMSFIFSNMKEEKLIRVLKEYKRANGQIMVDTKGMRPFVCMHDIILEENQKSLIEHQRLLNPLMKKLMNKEIFNWLLSEIVYLDYHHSSGKNRLST